MLCFWFKNPSAFGGAPLGDFAEAVEVFGGFRMVAVAGCPWRAVAPEVKFTAFRLAWPLACPRKSLIAIRVCCRPMLATIEVA